MTVCVNIQDKFSFLYKSKSSNYNTLIRGLLFRTSTLEFSTKMKERYLYLDKRFKSLFENGQFECVTGAQVPKHPGH